MANPLDAYKKALKKRQREKRSSERADAKDAQQLLQNPDKLKKELDELNHKAVIGRITEEALARRDKLEKIWTDYCQKKTKETLAYIAQAQARVSENDDSQENESESSGESSDDDGCNKCVIEIGGKSVEISRKPKRVTSNDEKPSGSATDPSTKNKDNLADGNIMNRGVQGECAMFSSTRNSMVWSYPPQGSAKKVPIPPPPPPSPAMSPTHFASKPNAKAQAAVKSQTLKIQLAKPAEPETEPEPVPLSKYLVPSQLRHKRG